MFISVHWKCADQRIEIPSGMDIVQFQFFVKLIPRDGVIAPDEEWAICIVPFCIRWNIRQVQAIDMCECILISIIYIGAYPQHLVHMLELQQPHGSADFIHLAIDTSRDDHSLVDKTKVF